MAGFVSDVWVAPEALKFSAVFLAPGTQEKPIRLHRRHFLCAVHSDLGQQDRGLRRYSKQPLPNHIRSSLKCPTPAIELRHALDKAKNQLDVRARRAAQTTMALVHDALDLGYLEKFRGL